MKRRVFNKIINDKITEERTQKREKRMASVGIPTPGQIVRYIAAMRVQELAHKRHTRGFSVLRASLFRMHLEKFYENEPESSRGYLRMKARMIGDSEAARVRAEHGPMSRDAVRRFLRQ